ncbi:MAG: hypothetical protein KIT76_08090 [Pseudolabrys sp.]|nr:hypothetical protein [Pseudolabrys sp.]MCW5697655.1 hypothetical protein [Bauldia sp.]
MFYTTGIGPSSQPLARTCVKGINPNDFFGDDIEPEERDELLKFAEEIADVIEYYFLADPTMTLLYLLCENARSKVLSVSLESYKPSSPVEEVLRGAWLVDMNPKSGRESFVNSLTKMTGGLFFRTILASYFLVRIFWSHSSKGDRLALLDAAVEATQGVPGIKLDKAKLKRHIDSLPVKPSDIPNLT